MYCKKCGNKLSENAAFCGKCGSPVVNREIKEQEVGAHIAVQTIEQSTPQKKRFILPIFAVVVIILAAVLSVVFLWAPENSVSTAPDLNSEADQETANDEKVMAEDAQLGEQIVTDETSESEAEGSLDVDTEGEAEPTLDGEEVSLDINVENEVEQIRTWFYDTQNNLENYEQDTTENASFYYQDGILVKIVVKEGTDGWNYTREYYFHDNAFYFAFIFKGSEEHRLYFKEDQLIRYIDENKNTYDYGETEQFAEWKEPAVQEAYRLLETM